MTIRYPANFRAIGNALLSRGIGPLPQRESNFAWIYILSLGKERTVTKIGCTVDLALRLGRLMRGRTTLAYPIHFECAYRAPWTLNGSHAEAIEKETHIALADWRLISSNDWYLRSPQQAEVILVAVARTHFPNDDLRRFPL